MQNDFGRYQYSENDLVIYRGNIWKIVSRFSQFGPGVNKLYRMYYLERHQNGHIYTADADEKDLEVIFTT